MTRQYLLLAGAFLLGVFGAFFLFAFAYLVVTDPADNITLVEAEFTKDTSGVPLVTGTLRNNADLFPRVLAEILLLDEDGQVVEDTFVTTKDLVHGETWHFEVPVHAEDAVRAVIEGQCGRSYTFHAEAATVAHKP